MNRRPLVLSLLVLLTAVPPAAYAAGRTFSWFAELVGVEGSIATLRVPVGPAVRQHFEESPAGTRLALVWSPAGDEVVHATSASEMEAVRYGFLLEAEFVSLDRSGGFATVKAPLSAEALRSVGGLAGGWITVTMPLARPAGPSTLPGLAVAARPAPPAAKRTAVAGGIAGTWTLTATRKSAVAVGADCTFEEAAGRLTGTCTSSRYGSTPVAGEIKGSAVSFRYALAMQGDSYAWSGELDAAGTAMKGTVQVSDEIVPFTATK